MAATGDFGSGSGRRWRPLLAVVLGALAVAAVIIGALVLRDRSDEPAAGGGPTETPATTPPATPTVTATPTLTPTPTPTVTPTPSSAPTPTSTPSSTPTPTAGRPVKLTSAMLLTGADLNKADPGRGWSTGGEIQPALCGPGTTVAPGAVQTLTRQFGTDLDASGGQWVSSYQTPADATAAYRTLVAAISRCPGLKPSQTHARKLTENRTIAAGDATSIIRWYDYPKPNDPGSEDGGFPHAITRSGSVVSVIAFREMGPGIAVPRFERLARAAATHLPR